MNDFTASNGITVFVREGGTVQFQDGTREESCGILQIMPGSEWWEALREFFQAEADERLGRWRDSDLEEWREIAGYEGYYEVSNEGRIRSLERVLPDGRKRSGKILRQCTTKGNGRLKVTLSREGVAASVKVHQVVARAFLGPSPEGKHMVLHSDGNHLNNNAANLRWGNNSDNVRDAVAHGTWRNQHTRDANPEPKPWQQAERGEHWALTVHGQERLFKCIPWMDRLGFAPVDGGQTFDLDYFLIKGGRRVWPEVAS